MPMVVLLKLIYAAAMTALLILFVAFGIRTFYSPPEEPEFPKFNPGIVRPPIPVGPGPDVTPPPPTPEQLEFERAQQRYQEEYEVYTQKRADYRTRVFLIAAVLGIAAVAGGVALPSHLDAIRLGLVAGGLGTVLYGVAQAGGDLSEAGSTVVFVVVAIGLVLVVASGYRWLASRDEVAPSS
jgi:hypothetical protein